MKNSYFILRHGQSHANVAGIILSHLEDGKKDDYTLTRKGEDEVRQSAQRIRESGLLDQSVIIISSPFSRCRRTAEIAKEVLEIDQDITFDDRLRERWFGDWEKTSNANYQQVWDDDRNNPDHLIANVESANDVQRRTVALINDLEGKYDGQVMLLVCLANHANRHQTAIGSFSSRHAAFGDGGNKRAEQQSMQVEELKPHFDRLQKKFGDRSLCAIYGAGCLVRPEVCFVFMNPTGKNVSASPDWTGLRAPWIGTKNIWKLFWKIGIIEQKIYDRIQAMRSEDWNPEFADEVYRQLEANKIYITNLSKSTQSDARHLPDSVFKHYLPFLHQEIAFVKPRIVISLGNQVGSILLHRPIKVAEQRKRFLPLVVDEQSYPVYPVYYPVGQGMRNMDKAVEDIRWIMKKI